MSWAFGVFLLIIGTFSTTYTHYHDMLRYLRLSLSLPCLYLLVTPWIPSGIDSATATLIYTGNVLLCLKAVDVLVVGFGDHPNDIPKWVALSWQQRTPQAKPVVERIPLPLPTTFMGRVGYTIDTLATIQGRSFFRGRAFDWASPSACNYQAGGRLAVLRRSFKIVILGGLVCDFLGTIIEAHSWDFNCTRPLTEGGLSTLSQLLYTALIDIYSPIIHWLALQFYISIFIFLGSNPDSWPPLQRDYAAAATLAELWSYRWHMTFRRSYQRIATPFFRAIERFAGSRMTRWLRIIVGFVFTSIYHLQVPYATHPNYVPLPVLQEPFLVFGLMQPLGLVIETYIIFPLTEDFPGQAKLHTRRVYLWAWMLWTGRWYGDHFIRRRALVDIPRWLPFHTLYRLYLEQSS